MKNIFKSGIFALTALFALAACNPQEIDDYSLGKLDTATADQLSYTKAESTRSANIITFTNTSSVTVPYSVLWDLGNGTTSKDRQTTAQYPFAGDYTVTLTVYTADGTATSKSEVLHIANSDYSLIDTPAYRNLTGGANDVDGKVWVFDQYNNFTKEVADAMANESDPGRKDIRGHMGLGALGSYNQGYWGAGYNEKSAWELYNFKFTFIQSGVQLKIANTGKGYGRRAVSASTGGFTVTETSGEDVTFNYGGGNYTFALDESGKYPKITLSGNAFMGYYCGTQEYEIFYQTDKVMALRAANTVEGQDWVFIYCLEELNKSTPPKTPKAVPLTEDFEATAKMNFVAQEMGEFSGVWDNPYPRPVNTSRKVYRYEKSDAFYSNLSFTAPTYKFDLATVNKIRMKVYIPSLNDYKTENAVAGPWISNMKLLPQLAVKLQDSSKGGNAWETQTEIVKGNLEFDKWIELEFDFSTVKSRKDYDVIVLQFGAEGHAGSGFFYFDDFSFGE